MRSGAGAPQRVHGGPRLAELRALGVDPRRLVDYSVNVNPYGPCPAVLEAIRSAPVDRYPDPDATEVREALAARWRVPPGRVSFGNGASELLWALAAAVLRGRRLLVVEPTFGEVRAAAEGAGARVLTWRIGEERGFVPDVEAISGALRRERADVVALCAPMSPTGAPFAHDDVLRLARAHDDVLFVLDESFLALSDRYEDLDRTLPDHVLRLRSLTKDHAIPGVRAGYLLAPEPIVAAIEAARPAWPTGTVAQAAGYAAVASEAFVAESRGRLREDRRALEAGLRALGLEPFPSVAPYLAFRSADAGALRRRLLARDLLVRDCASFGLEGLVRVAARPAPQRERLLAALAEELP